MVVKFAVIYWIIIPLAHIDSPSLKNRHYKSLWVLMFLNSFENITYPIFLSIKLTNSFFTKTIAKCNLQNSLNYE